MYYNPIKLSYEIPAKLVSATCQFYASFNFLSKLERLLL